MALKKPIETDTGGTAEYWRHCLIEIDFDRGRVQVVYRGHFNEAARRNGKNMMMEKRHEIPIDMLRDEINALQAKAYPLARDGFQNGTTPKTVFTEREVTEVTQGTQWTHTVHDHAEVDVPYIDRFFTGAEDA